MSVVDAFLTKAGLGMFVDAFKENGYHKMAVVDTLTDEELEVEFKMASGFRKTFRMEIQKRQAGDGKADPVMGADFLFWDFENCPTWLPVSPAPGQPAVQVHAGVVAQYILNHFDISRQNVGAYYNSQKLKHLAMDHTKGLLFKAGVTLVDCPSPKPEVVDRRIMEDMDREVNRLYKERPERPPSIVLITGDADYATSVDQLVDLGVIIQLIHLESASKWAFTGSCRLQYTFTWEKFLHDALVALPKVHYNSAGFQLPDCEFCKKNLPCFCCSGCPGCVPVKPKVHRKRKPKPPLWEFFDQGKKPEEWKPWSADDAKVLEAEYLKNSKAIFTVVVHISDTMHKSALPDGSANMPMYEVDFQKMEQKNLRSQHISVIRRLEPEVPEAAEDDHRATDMDEDGAKVSGEGVLTHKLCLVALCEGKDRAARADAVAKLQVLGESMVKSAKGGFIEEALQIEDEDIDQLEPEIRKIAETHRLEVQIGADGRIGLYGLVENIRLASSHIDRRAYQVVKTKAKTSIAADAMPKWLKSHPAGIGLENLDILSPEPDVAKAMKFFEETSRGKRVVSMNRVCHKYMWGKYWSSKKGLVTKLGRKYISLLEAGKKIEDGDAEGYLFHGTGNTAPEVIWRDEDGLDFKYANAGLWGKGVYFAEEAWYSCQKFSYQVPGTQRRMLFICRVLVGDPEKMPQATVVMKPRLNPKSSRPYDSVKGTHPEGVDVYIVYNNHLSYPEFLVEFE